MFRETKRQIALSFSVILGVLVLALLAGSYFAIKWTITTEQEHEVHAFAEEEAIEHQIFYEHGIWEKNTLYTEQSDLQQESFRRQMFFYVYDLNGEIVSSAPANSKIEEYVRAKISVWNLPVEESILFSPSENHQILMASMPIFVDGVHVGNVFVGRDISLILHGVHRTLVILGLGGLVALFLSTALAYWMAEKAIIPLQIAYDKQKQFIADASHELRTPLSIILVSIDFMLGQKQQTEESIMTSLKDIRSEALKMRNMIQDFLLLARMDEKKEEMNVRTFNLYWCIEGVIRELFPLSKSKKIELSWQGDESILFEGSQKKIEQLFFILLDNAIKYTKEGGTIHINVQRKKEKIEISVRDSGLGIEEEDQKAIFHRFYRTRKSRESDIEGSGLGLSIADAIVNSYNGKIWVESRPGEGSTFFVSLPLKNESTKE